MKCSSPAFLATLAVSALCVAGNRPYEFTDAGRVVDDYQPLVDFEQDSSWTVVAEGGAVASFERTQDEQLFGDWTARLVYRADASATNPVVHVRAARPIPLPDDFDTCTCWLRGTRFGSGANRDPETPVPLLSIDIARADGSTYALPLIQVNWKGWHLANVVVPVKDRASLKGAALAGFTLSGGTQTTDRVIHVDNLAFFREKLAPLTLRPRAKRNLEPLPNANLGLNTGAGTLDFPTREETILPDGARAAPQPGEPLPQFNGGTLRADEKGAAQLTHRRVGRTLIVDVAAAPGRATVIWTGYPTEGEVVGSVEVPFLNIGQGATRARVDLLRIPGQTNTWFRFATFDWYRSNASVLDGIVSRVKGAGPSMLARYVAKTDGSFNAVSERIFVTLSPRFEDVLPTIANPKSPWKHVAGRKVWRSHASHDRATDRLFWQTVHDHGMREILVTDHETMWREGGESFTLRTKADPSKGGDEAQFAYTRFLRDKLGFVYGPYNNYTDFAPANAHWTRDWVGRNSDGSFHRAWMRCWGFRPAAAPEACEKIAPEVQGKFGFNTAYCDVHAALAPWDRTDYDARVPGAGTFAETFYAWGELMEIQKRTWNGPVWSEGAHHMFYAGLTDGNYGQDWGYRCETKPWLVDFDLRKIHPLEVDFGMGSLSMFAPGQTALEKAYYLPHAPTPQALTNLIDRFIACTLAFGHSGYLVADYLFDPPKPFGAAYGKPGAKFAPTEKGLSIAMKSYFMVQQIAARYTQSDVDQIRYADARGELLDTSAALAAGAVGRDQVFVRYRDGTCVLANGNPAERLSVLVDGVRHDLPPCGYQAWSVNRDVVVSSDDVGGVRADYCESPAYIYIDGRGVPAERPCARATGTAVCRILTNGWEVISLEGRACAFKLDGIWKDFTFKPGETRIFVPAEPAVSVREEPLTLPTYGFGDPDPVPCTAERRYPYFRYDGSAETSELRNWKSVVLENRRVKVTLLPEIGGKVWGALDKQTGREFIYFNHAVKFRNIAMRGPWCSGGIEFNFGILGHTPTTATPVDWCLATNRDGSVSCFVSATEYINRTTWQVEVRLMPDEDQFYTRTSWFNGSNLPQPYYQWMTAAYPARGNPQLYFPGSAYIGHEGDAHAWPIDPKGRDLSRYGNNAFGPSKSYHVLNGDGRMFAIWWPDAGFGSVHSNAIYDKFGRKIWLWALSREGGIWEDLLTDSDGQYVELQSGRAFNQPRYGTYRTPFKHPTFAPGVTDSFDERWSVARDVESLRARCNETNYVHRPLEAPQDFDWNSMYGHYVRGEQAVRERYDDLGETELRACLAIEPHFLPALDTLAGLQARRGRTGEVRSLCARALAINTYDPAANYLDGVAALAENDVETAKERLSLASYSPEYRASAYSLIARARMRGGHWKEACVAAERALESNPRSLDALLARIACLRRLERTAQSDHYAVEALKRWPLFHGFRFERELLGTDRSFRAFVRNELPDQTFLELGTWYEDAGLFDEALRLFQFAAEAKSAGCEQGNPIGLVRAAYLLDRLGRGADSRQALEKAARMPVAFVSPFRRESRDPLIWAAETGASWKFRYWAAVYLAANGEGESADEYLDSVKGAKESTFYLYRASRRTGKARLTDLYTAQALDPNSWRVDRDLAAHFDDAGYAEGMLKVTTQAIRRHPACNPIQIAHATALLRAGQHEACIAYLGGIHILPSEHRDNAHQIWVDAWKGVETEALRKGDGARAAYARRKGAEYPENLGAGKPFPKDE